MSEPGIVTVEATGETVGEAKWAALRELEQRVPGLDRETVQFQVVSEGERGLLGVGSRRRTSSPSVERSAAGVDEDEPEAGDACGLHARSSSGSRPGSARMSSSRPRARGPA